MYKALEQPLTRDLQAIKVFDFLRSLVGVAESPALCRKWLVADFAFFATLRYLQIPRLNYKKAIVALQILLLWFLDAAMFGGLTLHLGWMGDSSAGAHAGVLHDTVPAPLLTSSRHTSHGASIWCPGLLVPSHVWPDRFVDTRLAG